MKLDGGVIQGDIISPMLGILVLNQIMQTADSKNKGVKCGRILRIKTLGYADDITLVEEEVEDMTTRLKDIGDTSLEEADMKINMDKTQTQHVHRRADITVTDKEARKTEKKYEHKCDFCERRFKTRKGMLIHRANCQHNYGTTDEVYVLEDIPR